MFFPSETPTALGYDAANEANRKPRPKKRRTTSVEVMSLNASSKRTKQRRLIEVEMWDGREEVVQPHRR